MKVFWDSCMPLRESIIYAFSITMRYFTFKRFENALKEHGCFPWGKAHNPIEVRKGQYDPETKTIVLRFWVDHNFGSWSETYGEYFDPDSDETCREAISLIGLAAQYERITEETHTDYDYWKEDWARILHLSAFH